jgi:hypothetical protein
MKDLINTVQQGLEKDLSIAKKMILSDENDYIIIQHLMKSLEVVNKQLTMLAYEPQIKNK